MAISAESIVLHELEQALGPWPGPAGDELLVDR
jgi:hypothetical protein